MAVVSETTVIFGCVNGAVCLLRMTSKGTHAQLIAMQCIFFFTHAYVGLEERELKEATMMKRLLTGFMPYSRYVPYIFDVS